MIIVVEKLCRTHHNKNLALLNFWKFIFIPGRAGEIIISICVSLMRNPGGVIAEHHTLEAVFKSQPLRHNGERALTPATHCQIRPAITVGSNRMVCAKIASSRGGRSIKLPLSVRAAEDRREQQHR